MTRTEKSVVSSSVLKQKLNAGLLAVQGGAFDIEPTKNGIAQRYGAVFLELATALAQFGALWSTPAVTQLLASINLKNSNLIATNTYKATSNLFALRDALISAYSTIIIMGITIAFELGGFDDIKGVTAVVVAISQTPITQFPALEDYFNLVKQLFNAVSVRDVALATKLGNDIKAGSVAMFTGLIQSMIGYYVVASKAQGGSGVYKNDLTTGVGAFLGKLVLTYKPVTDGNIDAIVALASQPVPSL